jgi:hypothetical protein
MSFSAHLFLQLLFILMAGRAFDFDEIERRAPRSMTLVIQRLAG